MEMFQLSESSQCVTCFSMLFFRAIAEFGRPLSDFFVSMLSEKWVYCVCGRGWEMILSPIPVTTGNLQSHEKIVECKQSTYFL